MFSWWRSPSQGLACCSPPWLPCTPCIWPGLPWPMSLVRQCSYCIWGFYELQLPSYINSTVGTCAAFTLICSLWDLVKYERFSYYVTSRNQGKRIVTGVKSDVTKYASNQMIRQHLCCTQGTCSPREIRLHRKSEKLFSCSVVTWLL